MKRREHARSLCHSIIVGIRSSSHRYKRLHLGTGIVLLCCFGAVSISFHHISLKSKATAAQHRGACFGYNGILHISQGDREGAAGTIFFLFVVNQLLYAQRYNLIPWVHLTNTSQHVYDHVAHGALAPQTIVVNGILQPTWLHYSDSLAHKTFGIPGPPLFHPSGSPTVYTVSGNGVWKSYFHPVSEFTPADLSCQQLPLVRLSYSQIIPGLHLHSPWAVRAWRYGGLPPSLRNDSISYEAWFRPQRQRAHTIVKQYVHLLPVIEERARRTNPSQKCLAVHIRHSDKGNRRKRIPLRRFIPYMEAYLEVVPEGIVYVATDSNQVLDAIQSRPRFLWQANTQRSNDTTAVFRIFPHHTTNLQVLVDIRAMTFCQWMLHGLSAVSEAVLYLNPDVQNINLEEPQHPKVEVFQRILQG